MIRPTGHFEAARERKRVVDDRRRRERAHEQRRETDQKEKAEDRLENEQIALGLEVSIATEQMIEDMTARLEKYSEANMQAMMLNRQQAEIVAAKIASILETAHTLPDGRRVFRTEDGTGVVDEFGEVVPPEVISPDEIDPNLSSWESFKNFEEEGATLDKEHAKQLEFQSRLDAGDDVLRREGVTQADLDALDAELMTSMPQSARAQVRDLSGVTPDAQLGAAFAPASSMPSGSDTRLTFDPTPQTFD